MQAREPAVIALNRRFVLPFMSALTGMTVDQFLETSFGPGSTAEDRYDARGILSLGMVVLEAGPAGVIFIVGYAVAGWSPVVGALTLFTFGTLGFAGMLGLAHANWYRFERRPFGRQHPKAMILPTGPAWWTLCFGVGLAMVAAALA